MTQNAEAVSEQPAALTRERKVPLDVLLNPQKTPALGVQTYEYFESDGAKREASRDRFVVGEIPYIVFQYKEKLYDEVAVDTMIISLNEVIRRTDEIEDLLERDVTYSTAAFRLAELYFIKTACRLNRQVEDGAPIEDIAATAEIYREMNKELYGEIQEDEHDEVRGEIWAIIDSKKLHPSAEIIRDELINGFNYGDQCVEGFAPSDKRLPAMDQLTIDWTREVIMEHFKEFRDVIQKYWDHVILPRSMAENIDPFIDNKRDVIPIFESLLSIIDPDRSSGVRIVARPDASNISFDPSTLELRVGIAERAETIDTVDDLFAIAIHEFIIHAGRTVHGLKTDAPVAGFGIYTDLLEGENSDYLTFEEGLGALLQATMKGTIKADGSSQWTITNMRHHLNLGLMQFENRSQREAQEIGWRLGLLTKLKDGEEPTADKIAKEKKIQAGSFSRIKRSIPSDLPAEIPALFFAKDLAYVRGRRKVLPVLSMWAHRDDRVSFMNSTKTKTDPTNSIHREFNSSLGLEIAA
ncbi:MAG: hypothetical protein WAT17_04285 [Candidatus Saccharimonadales bacterium]